MGEGVAAFALCLLSRLEVAPSPVLPPSDATLVAADGEAGEVDVKVLAERTLPYALVKNGQVVDGLPPASTLAEVVDRKSVV